MRYVGFVWIARWSGCIRRASAVVPCSFSAGNAISLDFSTARLIRSRIRKSALLGPHGWQDPLARLPAGEKLAGVVTQRRRTGNLGREQAEILLRVAK